METIHSFLGTGWGFPPEFSKTTKTVQLTSDEEDIENSLRILLATRLGERIMVPDYGCNLDELLFKPLNLTLKTYVADLIKKAVLYHEPRIDVSSIEMDSVNALNGELLIEIQYTVRATNSRKNVVFPFYTTEGSET